MRNQRIEGRPPLGGVKMGDRAGISSVRPEPVDRLGRERDQPAAGQYPGGSFRAGLAGR
ncbi:hypothetical protein ACVWWR_005269 [Bradyrhizobium sp. LM3.2]